MTMLRLTTSLLLLLLPTWLLGQNATLRQDRVYAGDTIELTITYDAGIPSLYAVDSDSLETDFELLGSDSRVFRIQQDGQSLHRMQWEARLLARRTGLLEIPALRFGDNYSNAVQVQVDPVPVDVQAGQNVFVEIKAVPPNPYPRQQTRIVTRLLHNLALDNGALNEPKVRQTQMYRSGRDSNYQVVHKGEAFSVLERSVLIVPQASDDLIVQPARFDARLPVPEPGEGNRLDGEFRHIHRKSERLLLRMRDLPDGVNAANWLPASTIEISLERENPQQELQAGSSLGVTLSIQATGLSADDLPANLLLRDSQQFKIYADQEVRSTSVSGEPGEEDLRAILQQRYVILLEQVGEVILPELTLDWWDVEREQARVARLEPLILKVAAAAISPNGENSSADALRYPADETHSDLTISVERLWPWIAGTLAVVMLLFFACRLNKPTNPLSRYWRELRALRWQRLEVERACRNNQAAAARQKLIAWARLFWKDPNIGSLRQIAARTGSTAWKLELERLDGAIFSSDRFAWQGEELLRLLARQYRNWAGNKSRLPDNELPGPYPPAVTSRRPAASPQQA